MTHVEIIVAPDDPADDDPANDRGLTTAAAERLLSALDSAGFRMVSGPFARPPLGGLRPGRGLRAGHEAKGVF